MPNNESETSLASGGRVRISPLQGRTNYQVWKVRVQTRLAMMKGWAEQLPVDAEQPIELIVSLVSDNILEAVIAEGIPLTAPEIWTYLEKLFVSSDLSSKANGLTGLIGFNYDEGSMLHNKTALLLRKRELQAAFGGKTAISIDELVVLVALVNLPAGYAGLRTTIQESAAAVSISTLFESLVREETAASVQSNRVKALKVRARAAKDHAAETCKHGRALVREETAASVHW